MYIHCTGIDVHECAYSVYIYIYLSTHTCMYIMYMYVHYYLLAPSFFVIPSFLSLLSCSILSPYLPSSLLPYTAGGQSLVDRVREMASATTHVARTAKAIASGQNQKGT